MRIVDSLLALPLIIIAVLVMSILGPSLVNVILVIGIVFTPHRRAHRARRRARRARARIRRGGRAAGQRATSTSCSPRSCPTSPGPSLVETTIRLGYAIFTSATLSFLALGIQQPSPDWGLTISIGLRAFLQIAPWWMVLFPALGARHAHRRRQPRSPTGCGGAGGMTAHRQPRRRRALADRGPERQLPARAARRCGC